MSYRYQLHQGDCIEVMGVLADNSVDSIVTDPPYGLGFMGKAWDKLPPGVDVMRECLRVLKPGGHLLAFGGSRTYHRLAVAAEDAGFEIRDQIMWVYGSGFPKGQSVSKAIDKAKRAVPTATAAATEEAAQWEGWGTALKPAHEPIVVARKPLTGTVAANVIEYGTGALNIDGCRINGRERADYGLASARRSRGATYGQPTLLADFDASKGRWPANVIHDGSDEVIAMFPQAAPRGNVGRSIGRATTSQDVYSPRGARECGGRFSYDAPGSIGSAARFFYCAKASKRDRAPGNNHPTVKPTALMAYLVRLITPPDGLILDPFMGSGSTGKACMREGFRFIGIELDPEYRTIAEARIAFELEKCETAQKDIFGGLHETV